MGRVGKGIPEETLPSFQDSESEGLERSIQACKILLMKSYSKDTGTISSIMTNFVECCCRFAIDLLKRQTGDNSRSNIILSSISLELGLAVMLLGSKEKTADQIRQALHLLHWTEAETSTDVPLLGSHCDKPGGIHNQLKQLLSAINRHSKSYVLNIVNRLYGSNTCEFLENYKHCLKELYNSELESVDFMNATEKVREKINSWVESQTNGEIKNLFPANSIDPSSVLLLVNAASFKGMWKTQFNPKDTQKAAFWIDKDRSISVEMMTRKGNFNLANITNPSMKVLEIPYENDELSFFFFLPGHNVTTDEIIKKLSYEKLQEWTSSENMRNTTATLYLPKVRLEDSYSVKSTLMEMGVIKLFIPGQANLSGISGQLDLSVTDFWFKGSIEINEDGVQAAVASRAEIVHGSNLEIKFNQAFVAILRDNLTGNVLYLLRISEPQ
ncbi:serpin B4-like [Vipera latastei]